MKIDFRKLTSALVLGAAMTVPTLLPADASAQGRGHGWGRWKQDRRDDRRRDDRRRDDRWRNDRRHDWDRRDERDRRQSSKNQWRNLGIAGGVAGVAGLLTGNRTLTALGLGGGLYSAYRYEQDRKSQNRLERNRYDLFRRPSFDYNGHHYTRRERFQGGQRHYYFHRDR